MFVHRMVRWSAVAALALVAFVATETRALAQEGPQRGGVTFLVDLGVGIQRDGAIGETATGLAGLSFGVGGFLTEDVALMFRLAGTNVGYDAGLFNVRQVSGVGGPTIQWWLSDRVNLEAGGGFGFWNIEGINDRAFGLILGSGVTIFNRRKHNLQLGVQYAPAFTQPATVHNVGFTFGYQFL